MNISQETLKAIMAERFAQERKFGKNPIATDLEASAIMGEEMGEICATLTALKHRGDIETQVIHLAAMCIAYLDNDLHKVTKNEAKEIGDK
jgi:hypothetical protein